MSQSKPELKVTVLSDYICPFCYIGHLRLNALRQSYDLKINWCFIEIHPETPPAGHSISMLNYNAETWNKMSTSLKQLASEEAVELREHTFTTNSRKALLLGEACKALGAERFYPLHEQIFEAFFIDGLNIADERVLRELAEKNNIPQAIVQQAWSDEFANGPANSVPHSLRSYLQYAGALQVKSVPTFIIGEHLLSGVITREKLFAAAHQSLQKKDEIKAKLN